MADALLALVEALVAELDEVLPPVFFEPVRPSHDVRSEQLAREHAAAIAIAGQARMRSREVC